MTSQKIPIDLDQTRLRIGKLLREIRVERRWTQAELAAKLGMSQARLSVIERGGGSLSGEQLVALLALGDRSLDGLLPAADPDAARQDALARLGARGLRTYDDVLPSRTLAEARAAIREVLVAPDSPRLVTALAPVLVWNIQSLNLQSIHVELRALGLGHRLGWLAENVWAALDGNAWAHADWTKRARHARAELAAFLGYLGTITLPAPSLTGAPDRFDPDISSEKTARMIAQQASAISQRWGILSALQVSDFREALDAAVESS